MNINPRSILYSRLAYTPPPWISHYINPVQNQNISKDFLIPPTSRYNLGQLPTPMHRIPFMTNKDSESYNDNDDLLHNVVNNFEFWMKRDDLTSFDMSGNKLRKLEFLLADAKDKDHDSVITIGGLQSNHCRATALAAKQLGMKCYLILRTSEPIDKIDLTGNLLFNRLSDATIYTVTPSTYAQIGSVALTHQLRKQLIGQNSDINNSNNVINELDPIVLVEVEGAIASPQSSTSSSTNTVSSTTSYTNTKATQPTSINPYIIPVGGSNEIGLYGYLDCVDEIINQSHNISFDHVVFACGSGGTATGLGLGFRLAEMYSEYSKTEYNNFLLSNLMSSSNGSGNIQSKYEYKRPLIHAMYVCDSAEYFYSHINTICHNIGIDTTTSTTSTTDDGTNSNSNGHNPSNSSNTNQLQRQESTAAADNSISASAATALVGDPRSWLHMHRAIGTGYARSTTEELDFIMRFASQTGILLGPVYSGKAMYYFCKDILNKVITESESNNDDSSNNSRSELSLFKKGQKILFIHSGGVVGLYDKSSQLLHLIQQQSSSNTSGIGNVIKMKIEKP